MYMAAYQSAISAGTPSSTGIGAPIITDFTMSTGWKRPVLITHSRGALWCTEWKRHKKGMKCAKRCAR